MFLDHFQDKKNFLKLYQTLHPEDADATEDKLDIVTKENFVTITENKRSNMYE